MGGNIRLLIERHDPFNILTYITNVFGALNPLPFEDFPQMIRTCLETIFSIQMCDKEVFDIFYSSFSQQVRRIRRVCCSNHHLSTTFVFMSPLSLWEGIKGYRFQFPIQVCSCIISNNN